MAEYVLFLRDDDVSYDGYGPAEFDAHFQKFVRWAEQLEREGKLRGVGRLEPQGGKTVRSRAGSLVVSGPFTEGKEAVLGYFVIDVADEDTAVAVAAECPCVAIGGSVEVRRLDDFPKPAKGA